MDVLSKSHTFFLNSSEKNMSIVLLNGNRIKNYLQTFESAENHTASASRGFEKVSTYNQKEKINGL
ncbi:hypothetical protein CH370_18495 [Leptospira kmetyi]|nr:hypothetical protein EFP84_05570 [Leptospira kmetyi]PJZ40145.1 hypothetical protein CH370_18495 [Leptospira kmetyi]